MRIAIVDDDSADRAELSELLTRYAKERQLTAQYQTYRSAEELMADFKPGQWDILFLDIYMSGITGMEAAHQLRQMDPACRLIFFTSSYVHAVESYTVQASYYLTKPLDYQRFCTAMDAVCSLLQRNNRCLEVHSEGILLQVLFSDILFMDCMVKQSCLHLSDRILNVDERVCTILEHLAADDRFLNCNRNTTVNMDWISRILKDDFLLKNGQTVPIRPRGRRGVKKAFLQYSVKSLRKQGQN